MDPQFLYATRNKLRFDTPQGLLNVEDLWDLPLTSTKGRANLDAIAIALDTELKSTSTTSFVRRVATNPDVQVKFDIVLHIIQTKQAESEAREAAEQRKAQKQQILSLIAQKENEALAGKSVEELRAMVEQL